jgi:SAM-dependent methyltransferase
MMAPPQGKREPKQFMAKISQPAQKVTGWERKATFRSGSRDGRFGHPMDETRRLPPLIASHFMKCPGCFRETSARYHLPRVWHQPDGSPPYEIRWCDQCDLGFLDPRPTAEDRSLYQESRESFRLKAIGVPSRRSFAEKFRIHLAWRVGHGHAAQIDANRIHSLLGDGPTSICMFGCGDLELLVQLRDMGHQVFGIDASERLCRDARAQGLDVWHGSAENPPQQVLARTFDAVFLNGDLPMALEPKAALQNARSFLKSGGYLFAEVPNHGAFSARRLGPTWALWDAGVHINFFTSKSLTRFIEQAGCEVKEVLYRRYVAQFTSEQMREEQEIWDRLYSSSNRTDQKIPRRKSSVDLWLNFVRTIFLPSAGKYEIVGLITKKV